MKNFYSSRYNPNHVLHRLLPQPKRNDYTLRQRTNNLTLPTDGNPVMKQNFVYKMVFKDIYWFLSNVQCYFTTTLLFTDIYFIVTYASIHCITCVCHVLLKDLLTYLLLGVGQFNGVIQIFARPTLVAIVTKIGKFHQKVGYKSAFVWDIIKILAPNRGFRQLPI